MKNEQHTVFRLYRFSVTSILVLIAFMFVGGMAYAADPPTDEAATGAFPCEGKRCITNQMREDAAANQAEWRASMLQQIQGTVHPLSNNAQPSKGAHAAALSATGFPKAVLPADLYFGIYPNYANSPLPVGPVGSITVDAGGAGYTAPVVTIVDGYGAGNGLATAGAVTLDPTTKAITSIALGNAGTNYIAPVVVITDATGKGASATARVIPTIGTGMRKFVDDLPGLCDVSGPSVTLGQCIPLAKADTTKFPGSDYYTIGLMDYTQRMHSDLPATKLRGYKDLSPLADGKSHYLGPIILAQRNRAVRIKFTNNLATSNLAASHLFIPKDSTYMGAGMGPDGTAYADNRADLHLHGGNTPWISDGTPHQWITPAGDPTNKKKGLSFKNVPDMIGATSPIGLVTPSDSDGIGTYYWTNQQSGRLMFYHDHAYGITRLNVYSGEAAGYLLVDPAQETMLKAATVPGTFPADLSGNLSLATADLTHVVPLVIQDKTFVDANTLAMQDPTWQWGSVTGSAITGDLWFPHVYMPNQWPNNPDLSGINPMGRWDYGPWFWPPQNAATFAANGIPYPCTTTGGIVTQCPGTPNPSGVPEAFMDTPVVNGAAYPVLHVAPEAYRLQILNADNDRYVNLQLYQAYNPITNTVGAGTEVKMVPAIPGNWPLGWPTPDARAGGWPDPATVGPTMVQIGTEGGLLPAPAIIQNRPVGYDYNRRTVTVLNVLEKALYLGSAERADVVVDFSAFAGKTLIMYNDAPAPMPAFDTRYDYYTGDTDQTGSGGAPATIAGYGPNTRTIMQIVVDKPATGAPAFNLATLQAAMLGIFNATQDKPIVPELANGGSANTFGFINATTLTFTPIGTATPVTYNLKSKAIQELFTLDYGRLNALLGVEIPLTTFTVQTTIPYGYVDPPTEIMKDGETQIWKITHNGVDTHAVHFHLFNVQLLNRVGWDGSIRPPAPNELGWKDTVQMNPLEDIIVAMKTVKQTLPFPLPDSVRPMDVTLPVGATVGTGFTGMDINGLPITVKNDLVDYSNEYVWHCHLLGHEENDMMRPIVFQVAPEMPSGLSATSTPSGVVVSWIDRSASETAFVIQRDTTAGFAAPVTLPVVATTNPNSAFGSTMSTIDATPTAGINYYRIQAINDAAYNQQVYTSPQNPLATTTLASAFTAPVSVAVVPTVNASPTSLAFGSWQLNTNTMQTVILSNVGVVPFTISGIAITGTNASEFSQTTTCGATLAAAATCTVSVTFTPTSMGAKTASLGVNGNATVTVPMTGTGLAPRAGVSPASLSFNATQIGESSTTKIVTLSNSGNMALTIGGITRNGTNATSFSQTTTCGTSLAAAASCTISVTMRPRTSGPLAANLVITSNDPTNPTLSVPLSGIGSAIRVSPTSLTFSSQTVGTVSTSKSVSITNLGGSAISISGIAVTGANSADFSGGMTTTCGASLAAASSCTVSVKFSPNAAGTRTAAITITDADASSPQTVTLTGTALAAPVMSLTPTSLNLGTVTRGQISSSQLVTVSNTGGTSMTFASSGAFAISGAQALMFQVTTGGNCVNGGTLSAGSSCTVSLRFRPTFGSTTGAKTSTLTVKSNASNSPQAVALTGTAR